MLRRLLVWADHAVQRGPLRSSRRSRSASLPRSPRTCLRSSTGLLQLRRLLRGHVPPRRQDHGPRRTSTGQDRTRSVRKALRARPGWPLRAGLSFQKRRALRASLPQVVVDSPRIHPVRRRTSRDRRSVGDEADPRGRPEVHELLRREGRNRPVVQVLPLSPSMGIQVRGEGREVHEDFSRAHDAEAQ